MEIKQIRNEDQYNLALKEIDKLIEVFMDILLQNTVFEQTRELREAARPTRLNFRRNGFTTRLPARRAVAV